MTPRFSLGRTVATPGALALGIDLAPYMRRHHCGDWGEVRCHVSKAPSAFRSTDPFSPCFIAIIPFWVQGLDADVIARGNDCSS